MSHAYRSSYQHIVGTRVAEVKLAADQLAPLLPHLRSVLAARRARVAAGTVGVAAAILVAAASIADDTAPTLVLIGGGGAALLTYVMGRALGALRGAGVGRIPALTGHLDADLARLEAESPVRAIASVTEETDRLETWSTGLPLAAIALLAPLTLHFGFWVLLCAPHASLESCFRDFTQWIRASLLIVGHAHLALVVCTARFARKMRRLDAPQLGAMSTGPEWAKALGLAVLVAALPGLLLFAIPPLLAAGTGLAFIPFMYVFMHHRLRTERTILQLARDAAQVRIADPSAASAALEDAEWSEAPVAASRVTPA
jgi:hypothetical protein